MVVPHAPLVAALLVALLALPPRLVDVDRYVTTDEIFWLGRAANFGRALATGRPDQTFQSGHPGVTTMWLAALGMGPDLSASIAGTRREVSRREVVDNPRFLEGLASARRAIGVATAVGLGLGAWLVWRLLGPGPALLGGILLALDPFLAGHSRLVHLDALESVWMLVAVLGAVARWSGGPLVTLAVAALATALALLSKAPALFLVGFTPLSAVIIGGPGALKARRLWIDLASWAALAAAAYVALWPAIWAAPGDTLARVIGFIGENANPSHATLSDGGSGWLFYPLVLALRSSPLAIIGVGLLVALPPPPCQRRAAMALGVAVLGFGLAMAVAAKSFDRYLLPVFPLVDVLAGIGLWGLARRWGRHAGWAATALSFGTAAVSAALILGAWPYGFTYANPMLGGAGVAAASVATGWGEGLDEAAAFLNAMPAAERLRVGMPGEIYTTVLDSQFAGRVSPAEGADAAAYDFAVIYVRNLQLGEIPSFLDERFLRWDPTATVLLNGVPYVWIYESRLGAPVGARFGQQIELVGYGLGSATARSGRDLDVRLRWRPLEGSTGELSVALELRGPGESVTWAAPLASGLAETRVPGVLDGRYGVPVRPGLPPGEYMLAVRVVDMEGHALAVDRRANLGPLARAEPDAVALRGVSIR